MSSRVEWIDWAKFVGIALVIYAHIPNAFFGSFAFLFHMPFFFMLSGYLYKVRPFKEEIKRSWKALLVPYLAYNSLIFIITPPHPVEFKSFLYVLSGNQEMLPGNLRAMWFLVSLLIMRLVSSVLNSRMYVASALTFFVAVVLIRVGWLKEEYDFFQIKTTMLCYQFFVFGYALKNIPSLDLFKHVNKIASYSICVIGIILLLLIGWKYVGTVNLFRGEMGDSIMLFLMVSYGVSYLLIKLFQLSHLKGNEVIKRYSSGTIFIVCTHQTLILVICHFISCDRFIVPILITILILILSYPAIILLEKYCPFMLGKRKL